VLATAEELSRRATAAPWRLLLRTPDENPAPSGSAFAVEKAGFNTHSAFTAAVQAEWERLVFLEGWKETTFKLPSGPYPYIFRSPVDFWVQSFKDSPVKHLFTASATGVPSELVGPFRGEVFEQYQSDVRASKGPSAFVLPVTLYSDAATLPNSGAGHVHPLRLRVNCLDPDLPAVWHNIGAFLPVFTEMGGCGAGDRAKMSRREALQRGLFAAYRDLIDASHEGISIDFGPDWGV